MTGQAEQQETIAKSEIREKYLEVQEKINSHELQLRILRAELRSIQIKCRHKDIRKLTISGFTTATCNDCGFQYIDHAWRFSDAENT